MARKPSQATARPAGSIGEGRDPRSTPTGSSGPLRGARPVSIDISESASSRYTAVRTQSEKLCEPLTPEDMQVQAAPHASPAKWHLAHTTWFFERFILRDQLGQGPVDERYEFIFNSYYNAVGPQHKRECRGLLTRPTAAEVLEYRRRVDERMCDALQSESVDAESVFGGLLEIGMNHEQQHQELLLTDVRLALFKNPLRPAYLPGGDEDDERGAAGDAGPVGWVRFDGGVRTIGRDPGQGFGYDNEGPRHRVLLEPFEIATRPATCGDYLAFMADGGYERTELWLDEGWGFITENRLGAPCYWEERDGGWAEFTLAGMRAVDMNAPVCGLSFYEADAFARWSGARLPTEAEWEVACVEAGATGELLGGLPSARPLGSRATGDRVMHDAIGTCWEWTGSAYRPYPGFRPAAGAIGEYNGKFMCGQFVLRGGSSFTPAGHVRPSYRNFFGPGQRWQVAGVRLARDHTA